jgi:hypothetical protein
MKSGDTMRIRIPLLMLALALASLATPSAHAAVCSDNTIRGSYAFTIHGTIFLPNGSTIQIDGIALQVFDGKGNFRQVDAVADNGLLVPGWRPGTGSYSINADCTGTQTLVVAGMGDLHMQIIVAQGGNTIHQVVIDPGIATTAKGERVRAPQE